MLIYYDPIINNFREIPQKSRGSLPERVFITKIPEVLSNPLPLLYTSSSEVSRDN